MADLPIRAAEKCNILKGKGMISGLTPSALEVFRISSGVEMS